MVSKRPDKTAAARRSTSRRRGFPKRDAPYHPAPRDRDLPAAFTEDRLDLPVREGAFPARVADLPREPAREDASRELIIPLSLRARVDAPLRDPAEARLPADVLPVALRMLPVDLLLFLPLCAIFKTPAHTTRSVAACRTRGRVQ